MNKLLPLIIYSLFATSCIMSMEAEYVNLSEQLYQKTLTAKKVKDLCKNGALVDYESPLRGHYTPLAYWIHKKDNPKSISIVKKLLQLGADATYMHSPNKAPFFVALQKQHSTKLELLLKYKKNDFPFVWSMACSLPNDTCLHTMKLLIAKSSQSDLDAGLLYCVKNLPNPLEISRILIDHGANPDVALFAGLRRISAPIDSFKNDPGMQTFTYLCDHQASDQQTINELTSMYNFIGYRLYQIKNNQISKKIETLLDSLKDKNETNSNI